MVYNSSSSLKWSSQEQQHVTNIIFYKISLASEQQQVLVLSHKSVHLKLSRLCKVTNISAV
jgi:hypothetical protein